MPSEILLKKTNFSFVSGYLLEIVYGLVMEMSPLLLALAFHLIKIFVSPVHVVGVDLGGQECWDALRRGGQDETVIRTYCKKKIYLKLKK